MNKQIQTFSFSPTINLFQDGKWTRTITSSETTNSVFNKIDDNNSFSISIPACWGIPNYLLDRNIDKLKN